jgi:hypothetical protein
MLNAGTVTIGKLHTYWRLTKKILLGGLVLMVT